MFLEEEKSEQENPMSLEEKIKEINRRIEQHNWNPMKFKIPEKGEKDGED